MAIQNVYLDASDKAKQIVKDNIVIDTLNCVGLFEHINWVDSPKASEVIYGYFDRAREAGITAMGVCMSPDPMSDREVIYRIANLTEAISRHPDKYLLARNTRDIREAHASGRLAIYTNFQGTTLYDQNPKLVGIFRQLGLGFSLMAYNNRYRVGDGVYEPENAGLTAWGRTLVQEMIRYGMPIDVSHGGVKLTADTIAFTKEVKPGWPIIYSHTGLKRYVDHIRAATDENAKALADAGGVMNVCLCNVVVTENPTKEIIPQEHAGAIACAIDYLGEDHVGIATDDFHDQQPFMDWAADKLDKYPDGGKTIQDVVDGVNMFAELAKCLPAIVDVLLDRGYSEEIIVKAIGGNTLRMFENSWDVGITNVSAHRDSREPVDPTF